MATNSSNVAWEIPWTEEPGGLLSMGLQKVRHDLVTKQQQQSPHLIKSIYKKPVPDITLHSERLTTL